MAMPRGLAEASVSGIEGSPVLEEKRTVIGVEGLLKCGALERVDAVLVGVNVPVRSWPLAWAGGVRRMCLWLSSLTYRA